MSTPITATLKKVDIPAPGATIPKKTTGILIPDMLKNVYGFLKPIYTSRSRLVCRQFLLVANSTYKFQEHVKLKVPCRNFQSPDVIYRFKDFIKDTFTHVQSFELQVSYVGGVCKLGSCGVIPDKAVLTVLSAYPKLTGISVTGQHEISRRPNRKHMSDECDDEIGLSIFSTLKHLKHLDIKDFLNIASLSSLKPLHDLPQLTSLTLRHDQVVFNQMIRSYDRFFELKLTSLTIYRPQYIIKYNSESDEAEAVQENARDNKKFLSLLGLSTMPLESLSLCNMEISDNALEGLIQLKSLKILNLRGCTGIKAEEITALQAKRTELEIILETAPFYPD